MQLKYLFQATYKDGSTYTQNEEDKSVTEPEIRSCYFDVKVDEVQSFFLFNNEHTYSVNMVDGHFEVDGNPFLMHTDPELTDYRLVYYRHHLVSFNQETGEKLSHETMYCFGWQANDKNGKNVQRIMTLN